MIADQPGAKSRNPGGSLNPLGDQRFEAMFTNVDFELEEESEEFQRLHPILSHKEKRMKIKEKIVKEKEEEVREREGLMVCLYRMRWREGVVVLGREGGTDGVSV